MDLALGAWRPLAGGGAGGPLALPAHHFVTHGVVCGATGSGKTGCLLVLVEEALRAGIPVLMVDVKGDLPNLLLAFPSFAPESFLPWVEGLKSPADPRPAEAVARALAAERERGLASWGLGEPELRAYADSVALRVLTPGSTAGELVHVLSSLERPSRRYADDPEAARAALSAAVSLVLRLTGRDADPARSREHVLLSVLAEARLAAGEPAELGALIADLTAPPLEQVGALRIDDFLPKAERKALAASLNALLVSPTFASWREGTSLDVASWLKPANGKTPGVIVSVAHLDDEERALVLGLVLEEVLTWVRTLPGTQRLRALVVFDEVFGFLPPHPANPPTKRPIVALMKQARAFGVGVVLATQNPMDVDYRALSNAGVWCIGRLPTDADRARVLEGLAHTSPAGTAPRELADVVKRLANRWFLLRDVQDPRGTLLFQPRWALSFLRGPMTRSELRRARGV